MASSIAGSKGMRSRPATIRAFLAFCLLLSGAPLATAQAAAPTTATATLATVTLAGGTTLPYFVSAPPGDKSLTRALIAIHGYTRDATRTFDAAATAAANAGASARTLIVAPIFQVAAPEDEKCHFHGVPAASPTDALWRCDTWSDGGPALNAPLTSFAAMDALVAQIARAYPQLRTITIAGFSAGGQFVQRYAGFAHAPGAPARLRIRYVVADPSTFLYFDTNHFDTNAGLGRPAAADQSCPAANDWKFGTDNLPADLGRSAAAARAAYVAADIHYLAGALDTGSGPGTASRLLAKSCAAEEQGKYRLDRAEHYAAYDAAMLAHGRHPLSIVPGCAHSVTCVFPSPAARAALFGDRSVGAQPGPGAAPRDAAP